MNWEAIKQLARNKAELRTIRGRPFNIIAASDRILTIEVSTGNQYTIMRGSLESAVGYLGRGGSLSGPGEYREKIADERPAYDWAILRELGYLAKT